MSNTTTIYTTENLSTMTNKDLMGVLNQMGGTFNKKASKATLVAGILALQKKAQQEAPEAEEPAKTEKPKTEKAKKAPKNPDLMCIAEVIRVLDELKVPHAESWEGKGTAPIICNKRPFEFWKRNGRVRINYSPECVDMPKALCVSVDENLRPGVGLCATAYVAFANIEKVVTQLVGTAKPEAIAQLGKRKRVETTAANTEKKEEA